MKEARKGLTTLDEVDSVDKVAVESVTKSLSTSTRFKGIRLSFIQTLENLLKKALQSRFIENGTEKDEDNNCSRGSQYSNSMRYSFSSISNEREHSNQSVEDSISNANCINNRDCSLGDTHTKTMKRACCTLS